MLLRMVYNKLQTGLLGCCLFLASSILEVSTSEEGQSSENAVCRSSTGLFPDPIDCQSYYLCSGRIAYVQQCPLGQHFSPSLKMCTRPEIAKCVPVTAVPPTSEYTTTAVATEFHCPQPQGLFPNPVDCGSFYHCDHGISHYKLCPANLHFNPSLSVCDWPQNAGCTIVESRVPVTVPTVITTKVPVIPPIVGSSRAPAVTSEIPPTPVTTEFQCPQSQGLFPNPEDCGSFYQCDHGIAEYKQCLTNLHFNPTFSVCDWPQTAGCTAIAPRAPVTLPVTVPPSVVVTSPMIVSTSVPVTSPNTIPLESSATSPTTVPTRAPVVSSAEVASRIPVTSPIAVPTSVPSTFPDALASRGPVTSPIAVPTSVPFTSPAAVTTRNPVTSPLTVSTSFPVTSSVTIPTSTPPTEVTTRVPEISPSTISTTVSETSPTAFPTRVPATSPTTVLIRTSVTSPTRVPTGLPVTLPIAVTTKTPEVTLYSHTTPAVTKFQCPRSIGLFPNPLDCSSYYSCLLGIAYYQRCPVILFKLLHFNPITSLCDLPEKARCTAVTTQTPATPPVAIPTKLPSKFHCPRSQGLFPNPSDCGSFYNCIYGIAIYTKCPTVLFSTLHFSPALSLCVSPQVAGCKRGK